MGVISKNGSTLTIDRDDLRDEQLKRNSEFMLVSLLALLLSLIAFAFFYRRGDILLYGDAVAHLNIARRLTDSRNAGWDQIGTVWLPLPHLLVAPFVAFDSLWRNGVGGSIPSMIAYVFGVSGIFRLVRARASIAAASVAAAVYAFNPSMLYMQSTAMTESIFLAAVIWSLVYFDDFLRALFPSSPGVVPGIPAWRAIERCGVCLAAAVFTRYDGWIIAFIVGIIAVFAVLRWLAVRPTQQKTGRLLRSMFSFLLLLALCPTLWIAHTYMWTGHPLDWLNGPYSAKAIEIRTARLGDPPYPGKDHPVVAAQYFLKAARMNTGEGSRQNWLILLAAAGVLVAAFDLHRFAPMLLLWIPLPFYAYSVAYGSVPIFVPEWWPFSYYNVRYGLELLPAIAVFASLIPWAISRLHRRRLTIASTAALFLIAFFAFSSSAWCFSRRSQDRNWGRKWMIPICYREGWANSRSRLQLESQVATALSSIPDNSTVLMYTSDYVGAIQKSGIHFDHIVSESTRFAWDSARSAPFAGADYVVAIDGDPVAEAVRINPRGLTTVVIIHTLDKPKVTIYRSSRR
jgi:4-amino-4-deoxy-L-arabinose transferase-like glycosyltransferase